MKSGVIFVVQGALHFSGQAISPGPERKIIGGVIKKGPLVFEGVSHDF